MQWRNCGQRAPRGSIFCSRKHIKELKSAIYCAFGTFWEQDAAGSNPVTPTKKPLEPVDSRGFLSTAGQYWGTLLIAHFALMRLSVIVPHTHTWLVAFQRCQIITDAFLKIKYTFRNRSLCIIFCRNIPQSRSYALPDLPQTGSGFHNVRNEGRPLH